MSILIITLEKKMNFNFLKKKNVNTHFISNIHKNCMYSFLYSKYNILNYFEPNVLEILFIKYINKNLH